MTISAEKAPRQGWAAGVCYHGLSILGWCPLQVLLQTQTTGWLCLNGPGRVWVHGVHPTEDRGLRRGSPRLFRGLSIQNSHWAQARWGGGQKETDQIKQR
jgi:hypothetical protein